jgi:single-strand DNA-binding protein
MAHYVFEGVIKDIFDTQEFKNNFKKREIIVTTTEEYPQDIKFEFTDETGINKLDDYGVGEAVKIAFQLKGSEWQGKYFTNLRGIAISSYDEEKKFADKQSKETKATAKKTKDTTVTVVDNDDDDLPF